MYSTPQVPKADFYRRLVHLRKTIDDVLEFRIAPNNLFPALFGVFSFMWCKSPSDLFKSIPDDIAEKNREFEFEKSNIKDSTVIDKDEELPF